MSKLGGLTRPVLGVRVDGPAGVNTRCWRAPTSAKGHTRPACPGNQGRRREWHERQQQRQVGARSAGPGRAC